MKRPSQIMLILTRQKYVLRSYDFARRKLKMKRMALATIGVSFLLVFLYGCAGTDGKFAEGISKTGGTGQQSIILAAPTALKLMIVPNGFKLSWTPSPQDPGIVTGYEIVRSDLASGPFAKVGVVDKGVSQYVDTTASPETIYYYKVSAVAGNVHSPYSNTVTGER